MIRSTLLSVSSSGGLRQNLKIITVGRPDEREIALGVAYRKPVSIKMVIGSVLVFFQDKISHYGRSIFRYIIWPGVKHTGHRQ